MSVFKEELYGATDFSSNLIRLYSGFSKRFLRAIKLFPKNRVARNPQQSTPGDLNEYPVPHPKPGNGCDGFGV